MYSGIKLYYLLIEVFLVWILSALYHDENDPFCIGRNRYTNNSGLWFYWDRKLRGTTITTLTKP